jgi:pimeloyl-ACP methyl ester carboxylesterase
MPAVFVHGNPETDAIWRPLLAELGRDDSLCLSPPGFGAPLPAGFGATRQEYVDWLAGELRAIGGPVDLVGHDWGGGHVLGVAHAHPELCRTWCTDIMGALDPDYVWHDLAQVWQTPDAGEENVSGMAMAPRPDLTTMFESVGMVGGVAPEVAAAVDEAMGRAILALYRSAAQPAMADLGNAMGRLPGHGLVVLATEDPYTGGEVLTRRAAERAGARVAVLEGLGRWWMLQAPARGAAMLREFWASAGS